MTTDTDARETNSGSTWGRIVRETWVACASEQDDPKPSHLIDWDELDEWNKEVDRRIGDAVAREVARVAGLALLPSLPL